jgi:hypothetical protein
MVPPRGSRLILRFIGLAIPYGAGAAYSSAEAAQRTLAAFVASAGMPHPAIVDTGTEVDCYSPFTTGVAKALWLPVARALRDAARAAGLVADHEVTVDAGSLWRVPGTTNRDVHPPVAIVITDMGDGPHELADLRRRLARSTLRIVG